MHAWLVGWLALDALDNARLQAGMTLNGWNGPQLQGSGAPGKLDVHQGLGASVTFFISVYLEWSGRLDRCLTMEC